MEEKDTILNQENRELNTIETTENKEKDLLDKQ